MCLSHARTHLTCNQLCLGWGSNVLPRLSSCYEGGPELGFVCVRTNDMTRLVNNETLLTR